MIENLKNKEFNKMSKNETYMDKLYRKHMLQQKRYNDNRLEELNYEPEIRTVRKERLKFYIKDSVVTWEFDKDLNKWVSDGVESPFAPTYLTEEDYLYFGLSNKQKPSIKKEKKERERREAIENFIGEL